MFIQSKFKLYNNIELCMQKLNIGTLNLLVLLILLLMSTKELQASNSCNRRDKLRWRRQTVAGKFCYNKNITYSPSSHILCNIQCSFCLCFHFYQFNTSARNTCPHNWCHATTTTNKVAYVFDVREAGTSGSSQQLWLTCDTNMVTVLRITVTERIWRSLHYFHHD